MDIQDANTDIKGNFFMLHLDVTTIKTFDPFTHIYMFDVGFPPSVFRRIAEIFNASVHPSYLVSYKLNPNLISEYGFEVELVMKIDSLAMRGTVNY
jgi:hypothetical protein